MLAARRAGIALAIDAATASTRSAAANARGSVAWMPNRNVVAAVLKYYAPTPPSIKPEATSTHALSSTIRITSARVAPSASRTPISRVPWETR
jgi:hypothetical protein